MLKKIFIAHLFCCLMVFSFSHTVRAQKTQTPNVEIPEDVQRNYDMLIMEWSKNVKHADNCQLKQIDASNIPDSVYINRLYSLPTKMELSYNPIVRSLIERYANSWPKQVSFMLGQGKHYFPIFEEALDKEGLPLELKYLPVIESALKPVARSRAGAMGLWQFMAPTGRMYDLEVNSLVDERNDPVKSSAAAARFLKDLYSIHGDWHLVIAAYNCGTGNVRKAMRRSGGKTDFWDIYPYLPRETQNYVPIFIAATYIMSYHEQHNICPDVCRIPASLDSVMVTQNIHFQQIADVLNVSIDDLRDYNPQYKEDIIPGEYKPYSINLPINKLTEFVDKKPEILKYKKEELFTHRKVAGPVGASGKGTKYVSHKVKKGETLSSIARRYGVTVAQLRTWNGLKSNSVKPNKRLDIHKQAPTTSKVDKPEEIAQVKKQKETAKPIIIGEPTVSLPYRTDSIKTVKTITETTEYKIRKGDNLGSIAKRQKVTIADLKKWNGRLATKLVAGKELKIIREKEIVVYEPAPKLPEPELAVVAFDADYAVDFLEEYISKIEKESNKFPTIRFGNEDVEERVPVDNSKIIYHKVKLGETIAQIAVRYRVTKNDILSWNNLTSSVAKVGQRLMIRIPEKGEDDFLQDESSVELEQSMSENNLTTKIYYL